MALTGDRSGDAKEGTRRDGLKGWLDDIRSTRTGRLTLKIVIGVCGATLVVTGLLLVPLPGPGWLIVFAGLALLATEFVWAHRLLEFGKKTLAAWTDWLKRQGWPVRILVGTLTLVLAAVIVVLTLKYTVGLDLVAQARRLLG
ncbi:TIGR02611 family protein [Sphaerisporangium fuscum]|uniref:TIGR02611 family protein n=1 Tax=Sphaerisporangium fuscum TaxID=2835868 RepID=UPI001BDC14CC|nr:TIGR02611 family protein [Sphaerisporangium fuscum]